MKVEVVFDGKAEYALFHEGMRIADGSGPLPAPPVLFVGSLGACAGIYAVSYLRSRGLPFAGLRVACAATYADDPRRLGEIRMSVSLPGSVEERHLAPLERAIHLCTLKNTIECSPAIVADLVVPAAAA